MEVSATLLFVGGTAICLIKVEYRSYIIPYDATFLSSLFGPTVLFSIAVICATQTVRSNQRSSVLLLTRQMTQIGFLGVTMLVLFTSTFVSGTASAWANGHPFPPNPRGSSILSVFLLFLGALMFLYIHTVSEGPRSLYSVKRIFTKAPSLMYTVLILLFTLRAVLYFPGSNTVNYHPIDMVIYEANPQHEAWLKQASASRTLNQATEEYRRRYKRHPPP